MKNKSLSIVLVILFSFVFFNLSPVFAQESVDEISGMFNDGTFWVATKPENWNGTLLLDLDAAGFLRPGAGQPVRRNSTFNDWLYSQGFAIGGITREPVSYDFIQAADYLMDVRQHFIQRWNEPERTLALGTSRGAFVVRMNLELYPDIYDGGFMNAGGGWW